jgi:hypothetical protein
MGPGGLSLDGYAARSFRVQRHDEARLHAPAHAHRDRTPSSEAARGDDPAVRARTKYSKQDYDNQLVYGHSGEHRAQHPPEAVSDVENAGYARMPAKELQLFSGTLEKKTVVGAKVSWEPRHAVLTGKPLTCRAASLSRRVRAGRRLRVLRLMREM